MYRCAHKLNIDHISCVCVYALLILLPLYIHTVRIYIYYIYYIIYIIIYILYIYIKENPVGYVFSIPRPK